MVLIFTIIFFLLLSALFSGSEIAFISANKLKIELLKNREQGAANILSGFYEKPANFLSTMLVGNNIALVVFTSLMASLFTPLLTKFTGNGVFLLLANTVIVTIVVLIFGEFIPKTLFRLYANEVLTFFAYPLRFLQILLAIPSVVMIRLSNAILSLVFRMPLEETATAFTRLDLEDLVNSSGGYGDHEEIDKELFGRALNLKDVKVKDCMVPRTEIKYLDINAPVEALIQMIEETKLSRLIITDGDIDDVKGYVHHQQLLKNPKKLADIVMEIAFIPEVMRVSDVLSRFIKGRISVACVVDEFGGIAGLVTMEDLLEEIVGEIEDEYDQEEHVETQISDDEYIFSGRLEIDYLNEKYEQINFPEGEYHTLSGYLVMTLENIPEKGAEVTLGEYTFILEMVSDTKIELIRVRRHGNTMDG